MNSTKFPPSSSSPASARPVEAETADVDQCSLTALPARNVPAQPLLSASSDRQSSASSGSRSGLRYGGSELESRTEGLEGDGGLGTGHHAKATGIAAPALPPPGIPTVNNDSLLPNDTSHISAPLSDTPNQPPRHRPSSDIPSRAREERVLQLPPRAQILPEACDTCRSSVRAHDESLRDVSSLKKANTLQGAVAPDRTKGRSDNGTEIEEISHKTEVPGRQNSKPEPSCEDTRLGKSSQASTNSVNVSGSTDTPSLIPHQSSPDPNGSRSSSVEGSPTSYREMITHLLRHMPHLKNVLATECRYEYSGNIDRYDALLTGELFRHQPSLDVMSLSGSNRKITELLRPSCAQNIKKRYFIVEDMCPRLIEALGSTFWVNPEVFEEHLFRSGYQPGSYNDASPYTWNTNAVRKDYISIAWFRPVHRYRMIPVSDKDLSWSSLEERSILTKNQVRPRINVFRQELAMFPDAYNALSERETFPAGWEERVTIVLSQASGCPPNGSYFFHSYRHALLMSSREVIILVDPLPGINHPYSYKDMTSSVALKHLPFEQAYTRTPYEGGFGLIETFDGSPLPFEAILRLNDQLNTVKSTKDNLTSWLKAARPNDSEYNHNKIVLYLLWIIHRDMLGFLQFVKETHEEIARDSTNDYILQVRLIHWRSILTRLQTEMPLMYESLQKFIVFVTENGILEKTTPFYTGTLSHIKLVIKQNDRRCTAL